MREVNKVLAKRCYAGILPSMEESEHPQARIRKDWRNGRKLPEPALLDAAAIAALLSCGLSYIRKMTRERSMPAPVLPGASWMMKRWRRADIDEWLKRGCPKCPPVKKRRKKTASKR